MQPYLLDYLFIAESYSGQIVKQAPDDKSKLRPDKSAFYDVMQILPLKKLSLVGKGHLLTLNLETGEAELDGKKQYFKKPPERVPLKPFYYRTVVQVATQESKPQVIRERKGVEILKSLGIVTETKNEHIAKIRYVIGCEAYHNQKKYKFEMGVE